MTICALTGERCGRRDCSKWGCGAQAFARPTRNYQPRIDSVTPQTEEDGMLKCPLSQQLCKRTDCSEVECAGRAFVRTLLRWEHPPHRPDVDVVDVDGIGRYMVARAAKGARTFRVYLNGAGTDYRGSRLDCKDTVQRIVSQHDFLAARAKAEGSKKFGKPNYLKNLGSLELAAEWGFKQCEQGENLQGMLANLRKLMS